MLLFEREEHDVLITELVSESLSGRGQVVMVDGVASSGRTALLDHAVDAAQQAGLLAMRATCSPMERELAGSALSQLLHSVPVSAEPAGFEVPDAHGFCHRILRLAQESPLVIAVDDLHNADVESLRCLLYLARRVSAARVLVLVTCLREDGRRQPHFRAELLEEPRVRHLAVEPLSEAGTGLLLADRLGSRVVSPRFITKFHRASGGNPALLGALVEDYRRRGPDGQDHVSEHGYGAAVVSLLRRAEPDALRVAQSLAVLGAGGSPERTGRLAGFCRETGVGRVERTTSAMSASGLFRDGRFAHAAGRAAVLGTLTGAERGELNQRAARLLHDNGEPAVTVACHLAQAERRAEPWAVPVLVEAAEQVLLGERVQRAVDYLELAHDSCGHSADRVAILEKLVAAQWRINPAIAATNLTALVAAARAGTLDRSASTGVVRQLLWHGRHDDAAVVLDGLRGAADADSDEGLADEVRNLETWLAFTHPKLAHRGSGTPRTRYGHHPTADRNVPAPSVNDPWLASAASICGLLVRGQSGRRVDRVEEALRNLRLPGTSVWGEETAMLSLLGLLDADLPELVLEWCAQLTADDGVEESPTWHALMAALRAEALLRRGDLEGALQGARDALTLLPAHAWGVAVGFPLGTVLIAAVRSGDFDEAARYLAFAPPKAMFQSRYGLYFLYARGTYHLATQRGYAGLADFLACGDLVRSLGLDAAVTVPWRTGAAQAWLHLGNEDRARRLVRDQLARSDAAGGSDRGRSLRVLAEVGAPDRKPQLLLEAVELFEECGDQYEQAHALAGLGCAYSELGDSRRARTTLRRARHLATLCGAAPLCDSLLAVQDQTDAPPALWDEVRLLTDSEQRVAHLAVLGYTNQEIATKLYVTSSTVEQHLTRVYRKLDVKRRKDLPAGLGTTAVRTRPAGPQPVAVRRSVS